MSVSTFKTIDLYVSKFGSPDKKRTTPVKPYSVRLCRYVLQFVCVEVLRPSQPNGVMSSAVILPNHTFTGQA